MKKQAEQADKKQIVQPARADKKQTKKSRIISIIATVVGVAIAVMVLVSFTIAILDYVFAPKVLKPIVYLYPTEEQDIAVELGAPEKLSASYPVYEDAWRVHATPNGSMVDLDTNRELYALYWEGNNYPATMHEDGFVVAGTEIVPFLEKKLAALGLTDREAEEFITYWMPILQKNRYNYIHFDLTDAMDEYMPLRLSVEPDTRIRFTMSFKALDAPIDVIPQEIQTPTREGFVLVEWGGSEIR